MIAEDLARLQAEKRAIRVGVSGAGWIGSGFVHQVAHMQGMTVNLLADPDVSLARQAFLACGVPADRIVEAHTSTSAMDALRASRKVVTGS
jgi:predicted homoserine dehydrogenase-like protein